MPKKGKKINKKHKIIFQCSHCGPLAREDIDVWCNRCSKDKMIFKDGMYLCPGCFENMEGNFTCRICGNKKVKMGMIKEKRSKKE